MKPAILSPQSREEFLEAIRWIAKDNPASAKALKNAVYQAARNLGNLPLSGYERTNLASSPIRFLPLTGFPYIIVYDAALKPPVILRFLHAARDLPEIMSSASFVRLSKF
ncbi:MAG: type II toxin-antitoxin system RelE/ParE family toxin [Magnetococcus sp. DMHC-1]|nr:type II toxin-antitoxin system RelE/ParE family toxin [Magnetococcales bacterium]